MRVWYKKVDEKKYLRRQGLVKGYRVHLIEMKDDGTWIDYLTMDHRLSPARKPYLHEVWKWPIDGIRMGKGKAPEFDRSTWEELEEENLKGPGEINRQLIGKGGRRILQTLISDE